jgi:TrmH family RNA methyltransferase
MRDGMLNFITSAQNPKIKKIMQLRDKKHRDETGLFLIEGYREIYRAQTSGVIFDALFVCPNLFLGSNEPQLIESIPALKYELKDTLFQKVSYRDRPDGLLAMAHQMKTTLHTLNPEKRSESKALYVIAEAIEKPGNLGTILRSADGVGADGVIVCDRCTDIYNPNVVRASVGTLFTRPVVEASTEQTLSWAQHHHIKLVAATPSAQLLFTEVDLTGRVAIVVGTEQLGLSDKWLEKANLCVRIPMKGVADSLNVAMATTLLLYEALRQQTHCPLR